MRFLLIALACLCLPVALHHQRQAIDHHVEEATNQQAEHRGAENEGQRLAGQEVDDVHASDDGAQLEDRQVHGDDQAADQHAQDCHDHRLHQRGEAIHCVVNFGLVEAGHFVEHFIQGTGFLADGGHLHGHGWEGTGRAHGKIQLHTAGDIRLDFVDGGLENDIASGTGY